MDPLFSNVSLSELVSGQIGRQSLEGRRRVSHRAEAPPAPHDTGNES